MTDFDARGGAQITAPREVYEFNYTKEDTDAIYPLMHSALVKGTVFYAILSFILFGSFLSFCRESIIAAIVFGGALGLSLLWVLSSVRATSQLKRTWSESATRLQSSTYRYEVFDGYFVLSAISGGEAVRTVKVPFDKVRVSCSGTEYLILTNSSQSFVIKRAELVSGSIFNSLKRSKGVTGTNAKERKLSRLLLVLSILCVPVGFLLILLFTEHRSEIFSIVEKTWLLYLLLPFPVASIIFGFGTKARGYRIKSNIIVGIIIAAVLLIYGSFCIIFAPALSHSDEPIRAAEIAVGIDLPEPEDIYTMRLESEGAPIKNEQITYRLCHVYFDTGAAIELEKSISEDGRWLDKLSDELVELSVYGDPTLAGSYLLICNKTDSSINQSPTKDGVYSFIALIYSPARDYLEIYEYAIDYRVGK